MQHLISVRRAARYLIFCSTSILKPRKPLRELFFFYTRNGNIRLVRHQDIAAIAAYVTADVVHIDQKLFVDPEKIATRKHLFHIT